MEWTTSGGLPALLVNPLFTSAAAAIFFVIGATLRRRFYFFAHFCIPAAVLGGLAASLLVLVLHASAGVNIVFDMAFQYPMIMVFFTTLGLGGSFSLFRCGGFAMVVYALSCWAAAVFQNAVGVGIADLLGINPLLGVMSGAVALEGGHAAAAAFGPMAEGLGAAGAKTVAMASATYGLIAGGLLGGPVAAWIIRRKKVEITAASSDLYAQVCMQPKKRGVIDSFDLFKTLALILFLMASGEGISKVLGGFIGARGLSVPGYVGAMFAAVILRNLNDVFKIFRLNERVISLIADISLGFFLTMGMMNLSIWDLYGLGLPLVLILLVQTAAIVLFTIFILFPLLGGDYDAAVMCAGFVGHGMGAAGNAISNMNSVCASHKVYSNKAFLIVPICSAFLSDIFVVPSILWFIASITH